MIFSPLEQFEITPIIMIVSQFNGIFSSLFFISFTNFAFYGLVVLGITLFTHVYVFTGELVSTRWTMFIEALYMTLYNMVYGQIGAKGTRYFPLVYSLFLFILLSNLISMIPYSFAINAQFIFVISLSVTLWFTATTIGLYRWSWDYFNLFIPAGTSLVLVPLLVLIEGISNLSRSISLGLRLGANIFSGHLLLAILCGLILNFMTSSFIFFIVGFIPLAIVLGIVGLEFAISAIQAYVFSILNCSYLNDAVNLH